jgi:hypothetical protein
MWKYKNEDGATIVIRDESQKSMIEREGFTLVGEVEFDKKGKVIPVIEQIADEE